MFAPTVLSCRPFARLSVLVCVFASGLVGCKSSEPAPAAAAAPAPAAAAPARAAEPLEIQGRRIDITVTMAGYTPDRVELKAGEQVTLVFTRTENTECGAEVQVPSLKVLKQLPLNKPVAIPFQAGAAGEVGFACGMDMMKGTLVVM